MHQLTDLAGGSLAANAALRIHGTRNLVDAAQTAGVRRIVAQSIAWAYEPGDGPAGEATALDTGAPPPRRTTIEGIAALETAARELPEWVVLRYGLLYGPGTWYEPDGARAVDARARALVASDDVSSFVHVDDAAAAAVAALAWPPGAVNVCDDEPAPGTSGCPPSAARSAPTRRRRTTLRAPDGRAGPRIATRASTSGWAPRHPSWRDGFSALKARR